MSLIEKIMSLGFALVLSATGAAKNQHFVDPSFSSTLQLINDIISHLQKYVCQHNLSPILTNYTLA